MAYVNGAPVDLSQIHFEKTVSSSRAGGRSCIKVSRDAESGEQVAFQLGKRLRDASRCPFGLEKTHVDAADDESYKVLKLEIGGSARSAILDMERATVEAAVGSANTWFPSKKPLSQATVEDSFQSKIYSSKSQEGQYPDLLKVKVALSGERQTKVLVAHAKTDGTYTKPVAGAWSDLDRGCKVLPVVSIVGGVYVVNRQYGTSLVATQLCIVKEKQQAATPVAPSFGSDVDDESDVEGV